MNIFNSLGSNYDLAYVLRALFPRGTSENERKLKELLQEKYGGETILFYKGREALTAALNILKLPKGSEVAINGFTCVAVFNAIRKAGYEPLCLDLDKNSNLNFTAEYLKKTLKLNKNLKVVVVQNTFGYPCDIEKIEEFCQSHKLILIEDLAHCVGTKYPNGAQAGTVGDFTVLSFSQDKIIDAVSGGALIVRNKKYQSPKAELEFKALKNTIRDRIYPHLTYKVRTLYKFGLGKSYHFLLKKLHLFVNPMRSNLYDFYNLPNWQAGLALYMFQNLNKQLNHRRKIAQIYAVNLDKKVVFETAVQSIKLSSNLRFPIRISNREKLIEQLKKHGIYVSDIWYQDVAPKCPNADFIAKQILNLPTHINVSEKDALKISNLINQWIQKR